MKKIFLVSVATAALIGASGFSFAQAPNEKGNSEKGNGGTCDSRSLIDVCFGS